jgi:hypothetical protein
MIPQIWGMTRQDVSDAYLIAQVAHNSHLAYKTAMTVTVFLAVLIQDKTGGVRWRSPLVQNAHDSQHAGFAKVAKQFAQLR